MTLPRRRTLTIGFAVVGGIVAIALVLIPRHSSPHHSAVYNYILSVDATETRMTYALDKVQSAYRAVTVTHSATPKTAKELVAAQTTLRILEGRIAAVPAPPKAAGLRSKMLQVVRQERAMTNELALLVRFLPGFDRVLKDLRAASSTLAGRLAKEQAPTPHSIHGTPAQIRAAQSAFTAAAAKAALAQADSVAAYDAVVLHSSKRLRELTPPPLLEPAYRYQLTSLARTAAAATRLIAALRAPTRSNISQLSYRLAVASRLSQSVAEQRAEAASVKSYDARVRAIGTTVTAIQAEIIRLQSAQS